MEYGRWHLITAASPTVVMSELSRRSGRGEAFPEVLTGLDAHISLHLLAGAGHLIGVS
jgi:hypothetical protein